LVTGEAAHLLLLVTVKLGFQVTLGLTQAVQVTVELLHLTLQVGVSLFELAVLSFESFTDRDDVLALEHTATFLSFSGFQLPSQRVDLGFEYKFPLLHCLHLAGLLLQNRLQILRLPALRSLLAIERLLKL